MVNRHLRQITVFNRIVAGGRPADYPVAWTGQCLRTSCSCSRSTWAAIYWDDIFQLLRPRLGVMILIIMDSLEQLLEDQRLPAFERLMRPPRTTWT